MLVASLGETRGVDVGADASEQNAQGNGEGARESRVLQIVHDHDHESAEGDEGALCQREDCEDREEGFVGEEIREFFEGGCDALGL